MRDYRIGREQIDRYAAHLRREERSPGTVENYLRHARTFAAWLNGRPVTRERAAEWKEHLLSKGCAPVTVNAMLAALNGLFRFLGWDDCRVKFLKLQRRLFRATERELTRAEYDRLLSAARTRGRERLALLMETICATGIRVSEVRYLTVEAARRGRAEIALKESQGELHRLRTDIAAGKYISVEEVILDYTRFFVTFKNFAMAIPARVADMINGYAEPVEVRRIEKAIQGEIRRILTAFVVAGVTEPGGAVDGTKK